MTDDTETLRLRIAIRQRQARARMAKSSAAPTPEPSPAQAPGGPSMPYAPATMGFDPVSGVPRPRSGAEAARMPVNGTDRWSPAVRAFGVGVTQGATLGFGDEIAGLIGGPEAKTRARADIAASREAHPVATVSGEVVGAVALPIKGASTTAGNVAIGSGVGAVAAAGEAEGDERLGAGVRGAVLGGVTAGLMDKAVRILRKPPERVASDALRVAKRNAYQAVDQSGLVFDANDLRGLSDQFDQALDDAYFVPGMGGKADQWRARLARMAESGRDVSLSRLDDIRGKIFKAYRAAPDEDELLDAIKAIDDLIDAKNGGEVLAVAREANRRFRNVELLETALVRAEDSTASAGSGGNLENQFRSAFRRILASEKKAQFFRPEELDVMRQFVRGDLLQATLRRAGKLSPTGNGLMQALNIGAILHNPAMAGVSIGAEAARGGAEARTRGRAQDVIDFVGTGQQPAGPPRLPVGVPAGVGANALWALQDRP